MKSRKTHFVMMEPKCYLYWNGFQICSESEKVGIVQWFMCVLFLLIAKSYQLKFRLENLLTKSLWFLSGASAEKWILYHDSTSPTENK